MSTPTFNAYNIHDLREIAKRRLPKGVFEFVDRGTEDEVAMRHNRAVFDPIKLKQRNLIDVSGRSQDITLYGKKHNLPIIIAPTGSAGLTWYHGEVALARAAAKAGIPFTLATGSMTAMETVAKEAGGTLWMQLYMWPDRSLSHQLVKRAADAGFEGLVVTVDSPVPLGREYNLHNGFTIPFSVTPRNAFDILTHPHWFFGVLMRYLLTSGMPRYENLPGEMKTKITNLPMGRSMALNDTLTWADLRELRRIWPGKLMAKGVMCVEDARLAVENGADGVIISNHGGRVMDSAQAPIEVLPDVVDALKGKTTIIVDSGFRRGSDVVKALTIGADAVMIGRGTLYGTATGGEEGATRAITLYREEIERALALVGCRNVSELTRDCVILPQR